jgi:hypothetical protein
MHLGVNNENEKLLKYTAIINMIFNQLDELITACSAFVHFLTDALDEQFFDVKL